MTDRFAGHPLKRIALTFGGETARGEAMITAEGLEGGAVYALSGPVRRQLALGGGATVLLDLRPDTAETALAARLTGGRQGESLSNRLRKLAGLQPQAAAVLRDARRTSPDWTRSGSPGPSSPFAYRLRRQADRPRDLVGGRRVLVRAGRRPHACEASRRLLRRRDDRLGGADRRLPAAGLLRHRRRGGGGGGCLAQAPSACLRLTTASRTCMIAILKAMAAAASTLLRAVACSA